MPMFGVTRVIFDEECASMRGEEAFFSVARTTPFVALPVSEVWGGEDPGYL
jgi:hypothetical protein